MTYNVAFTAFIDTPDAYEKADFGTYEVADETAAKAVEAASLKMVMHWCGMPIECSAVVTDADGVKVHYWTDKYTDGWVVDTTVV